MVIPAAAPLLANGGRAAARAAAPFLKSAARGAGQAAGEIAQSVSARAMEFFQGTNPAAASNAASYITKAGGSNRSIADTLSIRNDTTQAQLLSTMVQQGMDGVSLIESGQLTPEEIVKYNEILQANNNRTTANVDRGQAQKGSSGNQYLDKTMVSREVEEMCKMLNLDSTQYAKFLRCVNSHTSQDVEDAINAARIQRRVF